MANKNFISKNNNTLNINLLDIPNKSYFRAIRARNIVKFKLLTNQEKINMPNGSDDVLIKSAFNEKYTISRQELVQRYKYLSGKKIKLAGIKAGIEYNAFVTDNTEVRYLIIPDNSRGLVRNNIVKSGMIIAYLSDESGNLSENFGVMNINTFKKMCVTPFTDKIRRNANNKTKVSRLWERKQYLSNNRNNTRTNNTTMNFGLNTEEFNRLDYQNRNNNRQSQAVQPNGLNNQKINLNMQNNMSNRQPDNVKHIYKYIATKRIVDNNGKLIGFVIMNRNNNVKQIDLRTIAIMCSNKEIKNLTLVNKVDEITHVSKSFIRGNGIKIEDLEAVVR